jgi:hypothetical protein
MIAEAVEMHVEIVEVARRCWLKSGVICFFWEKYLKMLVGHHRIEAALLYCRMGRVIFEALAVSL